jgi:hypothetical protein
MPQQVGAESATPCHLCYTLLRIDCNRHLLERAEKCAFFDRFAYTFGTPVESDASSAATVSVFG